MKLAVPAASFAQAWQSVADVASPRLNGSIPACVRLSRTEGNALLFEAAGISIYDSVTLAYPEDTLKLPAFEPVSIPVDKFGPFAKYGLLVTDENIVLEVKGTNLVGSVGGNSFKIPLPEGHEIPEFELRPDRRIELVVASGPLGSALKRLAAIPSSDAKWAYGIALADSQGVLTAVATNGALLGLCPIRGDGPVADFAAEKPVIPVDNAKRIAKFAEEYVGDLPLETDGSILRIKGQNRTIAIRLVEGVIPPWQALDEQPRAASANVGANALILAVDMLEPMLTEDYTFARLEFRQNVLKAMVETSQGSAVNTLSAVYEGEPQTVGLNLRQLKRAVQALGADEGIGFSLPAVESNPVRFSGKGGMQVYLAQSFAPPLDKPE